MSKKALPSVPANRTALPPPAGADVPRPGGSAARTPAGELAAWLAKYGPVERAILEARERRLRNRAARRAKEAGLTVSITSDTLEVARGDKVNFKGTLTVFESVAGRYLAYYASRYPDAMYLHFDVLTFDGIKTADSTDGKRFECVDPDSEYLTFKDIYVKISVMKDGEEKDVTFGEMLERYENGDYDAFYAEIENDNGTDKSLVVKAFQAIFKPILKITSSIINFIKKLFK